MKDTSNKSVSNPNMHDPNGVVGYAFLALFIMAVIFFTIKHFTQ